jgi:alpha-beta hydrolase superfamily lysophospholipase
MIFPLLSSCVTRRAADLLTVPRRAVDTGHFERETATSPRRFEVVAKDEVVISALELDPSPGVAKRGTAYLFHGFGNHKESMLPVAKRLADKGFRCIAWDSRGHGRSGGERASYGMREVDDALRVIKEARKRDRRPRGEEVIWGYSMGASVALQTLPELPRVKAAVLLAPFSDLGQVLSHQASQHYHGAMKPLLPWVRSNVRSTAGFDPRKIKPVDAVKDTRARLLFIHGGSDRVIPPDHSARLLDACAAGQGQRILLPGLSHGAVMWDLPEKTYATAIDFLMKP